MITLPRLIELFEAAGFDDRKAGTEAYENFSFIKFFESYRKELNALDTLKRPITPHQEGVDTSQEEGVVGDRQRGAEEDR